MNTDEFDKLLAREPFVILLHAYNYLWDDKISWDLQVRFATTRDLLISALSVECLERIPEAS